METLPEDKQMTVTRKRNFFKLSLNQFSLSE